MYFEFIRLIWSLQPIRLGITGLLAFSSSALFCSIFIRSFKRLTSAPVREFVTELHKAKDKTPSMGGIPMILAALVTALITLPVSRPTIWIPLLTLVLFGLIGFWDDWAKITRGKGISDGAKFSAQIIASLTIVGLWYILCSPSTNLIIPLGTGWSFSIGLFFIAWAVWVILCTDNAVNFTDGLDGLAGTILVLNFVTFGALASFLHEPHSALSAVLMAGVLGGFLWFNAHPAKLFMGDVGSLGFGATLAIIALMLKLECLIPLTGAIFVLEGISVVIQKWGFKFWKKRIFKMAPLHHHFELSGVHETTITARFVIVTVLLCITAFLLALPYLFFCS
ncbi:TPA: phospho-N-acetylmuramoyl-pentapeptide-transferase [Candidatus Dependentiae bacterium]|nr:MAG: Phospho-N-acetylmuramoyl-pentapeptide-transferase [candidate division TM6 bacterium GW2011_GWF2_43_87]HBL98548.1 phospho-N-acetylmuramoyl-pentapeptide-transferase [Candidatus Dependentiae bacterium]